MTRKGKITGSHFDIQILPDEGEEGRSEVDFTIVVDGHVHSNKFFVGEAIWTFVAEPQRWIHVLKHVVHFSVMDFTARIIRDQLVELKRVGFRNFAEPIRFKKSCDTD